MKAKHFVLCFAIVLLLLLGVRVFAQLNRLTAMVLCGLYRLSELSLESRRNKGEGYVEEPSIAR